MLSDIVIFGKSIPIYGLCFYGGIVLATIIGVTLRKRAGIPMFDLVASLIYAMIGGILGSKLLFVAVSLRMIIELNISLLGIIKGGFVFYGGLIGGILGVIVYVRQYKLDPQPYFDLFAVCLPIGHAIGRIGCFFAGCCYGIPCEKFGVVYTESIGATPLGVPLLPIQLIESAVLVILFSVMLVLFFKTKQRYLPTVVYAISYSSIRFILEFFRGDRERGVLLGISTSQWISLLMLLGAISFSAVVHIASAMSDGTTVMTRKK